ncbi:hypothetical protein [Streptomyces sp. NPDC029721]|uniref:hypothetical protein n=1 Tax=Streptomyces sp. NPDC029721 TaxID=3157090 RepID=UPI0033DBABE8
MGPAVDALTTTARTEADTGDAERAVTLLAAANSLRMSTGRESTPMERPALRQLEHRLRQVMTPDLYACAEKAGVAFAPEVALHYALGTAAAPRLADRR